MLTVPMELARLQARTAELLPGKPFTRDQLLMLQRDNVVAPGMPGLAELGIVPTPVELVVPSYISRFRPGGGRRLVPPEEKKGRTPDLFFTSTP
jgi:NADH dehydrogenase